VRELEDQTDRVFGEFRY